MGVFTFITDQQLTVFLRDYDLGKLERFEGIQQGVSNTNYHVWTDRGHYILTLFEGATDPASLSFIFAYTKHLAEHAIACPHPFLNRKGEQFGRLAGKSACLVNFLPGREIENAALTPDHCRRMGELAAHMHRVAIDFTPHHPNSLGLAAWQVIARDVFPHADEIQPGLRVTLEAELAYLADRWTTHSLPVAAVHADLFPDNVLFAADGSTGVIDFYYSCTDRLAYDLALAFNAWCFTDDRQYSPERGTALLAGYQAERPLREEERQAFNLMCRGAAMRIIVTRLRDWLFPQQGVLVQAKNPLDYVARLQFHQQHAKILS